MTLAIEPKKGIAEVGMVGNENTYVVTPDGGRSLTGDHPGLILIDARAGGPVRTNAPSSRATS